MASTLAGIRFPAVLSAERRCFGTLPQPAGSGRISCVSCSHSLDCRSSSLSGLSLEHHAYSRRQHPRVASTRNPSKAITMSVKPSIQFIQGTNELTIPDVRLTKSRDGSNGTATFTFEEPSVFDSTGELGEITGFYMIDEEGVIQSVDVSAKFVNGKPSKIEAKYIMRTPREWDRFMRFMERYSDENGLQFVKK